jgi:hypothetical protein
MVFLVGCSRGMLRCPSRDSPDFRCDDNSIYMASCPSMCMLSCVTPHDPQIGVLCRVFALAATRWMMSLCKGAGVSLARLLPQAASQRDRPPQLDMYRTLARTRLSPSTTIITTETPASRHRTPERKSPHSLPLRAPSTPTALLTAPTALPRRSPTPDQHNSNVASSYC